MTPADRTRFAAAIGTLAEAYRQTLSEATLHAYWLGLDDLAIAEIETAVRKALRTCRFMPAPIELRELSGEVNGQARATLAWDAFQRAVTEHGGYKSVQFDDPVINATVKNLGGWTKLCEVPTAEFDKWIRKDFLQTYQAFYSAGTGPDAALPLPGIFAKENALGGKHHAASERVVVVKTGLPGLPQLEAPEQPVPQIEFSGDIGRMPK